MWDEKKIRIIDIADELGVSTATVSNVIHGKTKRYPMQLSDVCRKNSLKEDIFRIWPRRSFRRTIRGLSEWS